MKKNLIMALKGVVIGVSMLIPGVSGGTMAVIMGIYDMIVSAIGSFYKHFKKSFFALLPLGIGAVIGVLGFSWPIEFMLDKFNMPTVLLFIGAVVGGIPFVFKQTGVQQKKNLGKDIVLFVAGAAIVALIAVAVKFLPENAYSVESGNSFITALILAGAGVISAAAFVLPGISGSYMLLLLGLYSSVLNAINTFNIKLLIPFGIGIVVGLITIARLMQFLLKKHRQSTFTVILGFIFASVIQLLMDLNYANANWIFGGVMFVVGFVAVFMVSRFEQEPMQAIE